MTFLTNVLLLTLGLSPLAQERDASLRVQYAVAPVAPGHSRATGLVVIEIVINQTTGGVQTRALHGDSPFAAAALDAVRHWRFSAPQDVARSRTSITFLFRAPVLYSMPMPVTAIRPWLPDDDCPPLPQKTIDPGYPPASTATGAVILEVRVNAQGAVTDIDTIDGAPDLTKQAKAKVKNWRFSPAIISGKAVPSTAFVVISFAPPI